MNLSALDDWLRQNGHGEIVARTGLSGGDICASEQITTASGQRFFLKSLANAPPNMFEAEATGLIAIAQTDTLAVPEVHARNECWLLLEYLESAPKTPDYWHLLGTGLARMHRCTSAHFGFECDNYCGATPQPNPETRDGHEFFINHRLQYQAKLAYDKGLLEPAVLSMLEQVCQRLPDLIPEQPAALLHGDLWSGNIHTNARGTPVVIDPACYFGWPEADIAMTRLFGGFATEFYSAYIAKAPLQQGWEHRCDLYNLYHLLNHLNLFGAFYTPQVIQVLKSYV